MNSYFFIYIKIQFILKRKKTKGAEGHGREEVLVVNQKRLWLMKRIERQNKVGRETIELQMSKEQR